MPAQSPTLSPTLSAMVAGLRGSSSGMPASTLPTRSAPTSAPLVKMPPPSRAKIEISEAPKPSATRASIVSRSAGPWPRTPRENAKIAGDAQKREASHEQAGHRARAEGDVETAGERFRRRLRGADVGAHRDVHADEAGGARQDGADGEADRHRPRKQEPKNDEHDDADGGDGHVLALQIGLRPFRHRAGNFLHARAAGVGRHQAVDRVDAVDDGKEPTDDYQAQQHARKPHCKAAGFSPRPVSGRLLPETAPRRNAMTAFCARFCDQSRAAAGPAGLLRRPRPFRPSVPASRLGRRSAASEPSGLLWPRTGRRPPRPGRPAAPSPVTHRPPTACERPNPCTRTSRLARRGPSRRRCRPAAGWGSDRKWRGFPDRSS